MESMIKELRVSNNHISLQMQEIKSTGSVQYQSQHSEESLPNPKKPEK